MRARITTLSLGLLFTASYAAPPLPRFATAVLPTKLPTRIVCSGGIALHLLSSHEPVCLAEAAFTNFLSVVARSGRASAIDRSPVANGSNWRSCG
jgi:hypothetical protein